MEGSGLATSERREPVLAEVVVDSAPTKLRESLNRVDAALAIVEQDVRRRVRLLLAEVISRSVIPRRRRRPSIRIAVDILRGSVRVQVSGRGLLMPGATGSSAHSGPSYPHWILDGLADRWGYDRRVQDFGMWFLLERGEH